MAKNQISAFLNSQTCDPLAAIKTSRPLTSSISCGPSVLWLLPQLQTLCHPTPPHLLRRSPSVLRLGVRLRKGRLPHLRRGPCCSSCLPATAAPVLASGCDAIENAKCATPPDCATGVTPERGAAPGCCQTCKVPSYTAVGCTREAFAACALAPLCESGKTPVTGSAPGPAGCPPPPPSPPPSSSM